MFNAVRMLSDFDSGTVSVGVIARLRADFTYSRRGVETTLDAGTTIVVDESTGLGYYQDVAFQIEPTDYAVSFLN